MLKKLWGRIGTVLWWLLWPVWFLYFRNGPLRSRVLVLCGDEVLVVQNWLGPKKFALPGGGCHKNESPLVSAVRELYEETGIGAAESALTRLGSRRHTQYGLRYHAKFFSMQIHDKPTLKLRRPEIFAAVWVPYEQAQVLRLDDEVLYALKRYRPMRQASLL